MTHTRLRRCLVPFAALAALTVALPAAADPLGFYLGAGLGRSNVKIDEVSFNEHATAWKALVGLRPIPIIGAEMEYVDFGSASATNGSIHTSDAKTRGAALFGLLYAPLPLPVLDVYAKVGFSRLQTTANSFSTGLCPSGINCTLFRFDRTGTRLAYGAGAQVKFSTLALRAEYERFKTDAGDPNLVSVALTWSF